MMFISPVYGERNTLFGIFMIILFTATLISHLPKLTRKTLVYSENLIYFLLVTISTLNIINVYQNYKLTNDIQNENIGIIKIYKEEILNENLELYKFIDDNYGWSMPYLNKYHEYWFKIYYEIPDAEIIWKNYGK